MKKISLIVIAVIAVAILAVGLYLYQNNKLVIGNPNNLMADVLQATTSLSNNKKDVKLLLLVDSSVLKGLDGELKDYSQDVKRELGLNTVIKSVLSTDTVFTLKKYVDDFYKQNNLNGILIIGNVPTGQMYHSDLAVGTVFDSQGYVLSDSIYQDVFGKCIYSESKKAFDYKDPECQTGVTTQLYWVARLTPNSTTATNLVQLKSYFQRNHAFRTGKISFKNNFMAYLPILSESQSRDIEMKTFMERISGYGTYNTKQTNIIDINDKNSDQKYLSELSKPNNYEAVVFNGHGLPTFHMKDIKPENLKKTSFVFMNLLSCSVGRFTTVDYLAGRYLFNGGLIVLAPTTPVFASTQFEDNTYEMLSLGVPFYKAFEYDGIGGNILGDPTLKMRYDSRTYYKSGAKIVMSDKDLSFSKLNPNKVVKITNKGTKPLLFAIRGKAVQQKNSSLIKSFSAGFDANATIENNKPYSLLPGKTTEMSFQTAYDFPYDTISPGLYKEKYYVVSNDPDSPLIEMNFDYSVPKR